MVLGGIVVLRAVASVLLMLSVLVFPAVYVYLVHTCPKEASFEAKRQLKRVLRGDHLNEDDPNKPKGYLESMVARASASVSAETAALTGYSQEMTNYGGAIILASLVVPSQKVQVYWVGVLGQWRYAYTRSLTADSKKSD